MAERRGTLAGPLRIAAPVTFGRMHLGPALYPFLAQHPRIELTLELDDRRVDAAADGYDAVVRHGAVADTRLVAWRLATSRRVLVAAPSYLARHGTPALARRAGAPSTASSTPIAASPTGASRCPDGAVIVRGRSALRVNNGDVMRDAAHRRASASRSCRPSSSAPRCVPERSA